MFEGFKLTEAQFAAALSFHWNTGKIKVASWVKSFKAGKLANAKKQFLQYNKPASIVDRRKAEAELLFEGKWAQTGYATEYTRVKLKADGSGAPIDWSSAKKINVEKELKLALADEIPAADKVIVTEETKVEVPVEVPVPVVPPKAQDAAVKAEDSTRKGIRSIAGGFIGTGLTGGAVTTVMGLPVSTVLTWLAIAVGGLAIWLLLGPWIIRRIKAVQAELDL